MELKRIKIIIFIVFAFLLSGCKNSFDSVYKEETNLCTVSGKLNFSGAVPDFQMKIVRCALQFRRK